MSARGENVPELGALLYAIAVRIEKGQATEQDAQHLRKIARQVAGEDDQYSLRLHGKRGAPRKGGIDVRRRFEAAQAIQEHRIRNQCSLDDAYRALNGQYGVGPDRLEDFWIEMSPLLEMDEAAREAILFFKKLEARGKVTVSRKPLKK